MGITGMKAAFLAIVVTLATVAGMVVIHASTAQASTVERRPLYDRGEVCFEWDFCLPSESARAGLLQVGGAGTWSPAETPTPYAARSVIDIVPPRSDALTVSAHLSGIVSSLGRVCLSLSGGVEAANCWSGDSGVRSTQIISVTADVVAGVPISAALTAYSWKYKWYLMDWAGSFPNPYTSGVKTIDVRAFSYSFDTDVPTVPSNECDAGTKHLAGLVGDSFLKLATHTAGGQTSLCFRVASNSDSEGGKITLSPPQGIPSQPVAIDDQAEACIDTPGNLSSIPPVTFSAGDDDDPIGRTTMSVSTYMSATDGVWLCAEATNGVTSIGRRLVARGNGVGIAFSPDPPGAGSDQMPPSPGTASSLCHASGTLLNTAIGPDHVWILAWRETSTLTHVCARGETEDGAPAGGRFSLETPSTNVNPVVEIGSDPAICGRDLISFNGMTIRRSDPGSTVSVCVGTSSGWTTLTVGTQDGPGLPQVTWTSD